MPVIAKGKQIVEKRTGKVVGHSKDAATAKRAATARNMAHAGIPLTKRRGGKG